jgi:hypothetical protein
MEIAGSGLNYFFGISGGAFGAAVVFMITFGNLGYV